MKKSTNFSRRDFIKVSAAGAIAAMAAGKYAFAAGSDKIRVGLIGCGNRGTGAARDCVTSSANVEIYAMGDLFKDNLDRSFKKLSQGNPDNKDEGPLGEKFNAAEERCFAGLDAYKKVIDSGVDMVILATPPHFRPMHLKAAVEAGRNVFMEKPAAVDPVGVRSVLASSELAGQKGLAIVAGTQRRHQPGYIEILKRIHNGDIGEIVGGQCYWNGGDVAKWGFLHKHLPGWSDMEWQLRNWYFFTWLSGDHIVEQHVHNIDVINWAIGTHPARAVGMGGRQSRTAPECGNIFDHFAVEYEYPNGARIMSMCRQVDQCAEQVAERVVGTKGSANADGGGCRIRGTNAYKYDGPNPNPYVVEHADLITSIRDGKPLNEGKTIAESTLTGIMGRMSAYTGRELSWDWVMNASKLDLTPPNYEFGDYPVAPVAIPGQTKLV